MIFVELTKVWRQSDVDFVACLNRVRRGEMTGRDLEYLNSHCAPPVGTSIGTPDSSSHESPNEEARARIMEIHSRKMNVDKEDVNFEELSRCCDDFNGAQVKAICVEAGMLALRREAEAIKHEDFMEAIAVVAAKKKGTLDYYA